MPSERRIWLSRRATVVLPVPGLPVNTRWWLVSSVGMPRSSRSRWIRSRLVSRRTSALTWSSPTSASSSASSSSIGRAGGSSPAGRRRGRGGPAPARPARRRRGRRRRWPGPRRRRRRRTPPAARCGSGRWRRSRRATARGRSPPRRGPGGCRGRSSGPPAACRRGRRPARAGRTACSGGTSQARLPSQLSLSRRRCDDTSTGAPAGSRCRRAMPRARRSMALVAVDHGGHEVARLDDRRRAGDRGPTALPARRHAVDERVDVPRQDPGTRRSVPISPSSLLGRGSASGRDRPRRGRPSTSGRPSPLRPTRPGGHCATAARQRRTQCGWYVRSTSVAAMPSRASSPARGPLASATAAARATDVPVEGSRTTSPS